MFSCGRCQGTNSWWHPARAHCPTLRGAIYYGTCFEENNNTKKALLLKSASKEKVKRSLALSLSPGVWDRFMGWERGQSLGSTGVASSDWRPLAQEPGPGQWLPRFLSLQVPVMLWPAWSCCGGDNGQDLLLCTCAVASVGKRPSPSECLTHN